MFFEFLRKKPKIIEVDEDGNVKKPSQKVKWLIYIILAAIVALALSGGGDSGEKAEKSDKAVHTAFERDKYAEQLEGELEEILQAVKGAGKVKAMVTVEEYGEKVVATDKKRETTNRTEEGKTDKNLLEEQSTVLYGSGSAEQPFVVKERVPMPSGVLVVAEGAADEKVRLELYEAVKALYGVSGHRIKITCGMGKYIKETER